MSNPTLLSFASKQIWPHVLLAAHVNPRRIIFLHSGDANESRLPASRLRKFFESTGPLPPDGVTLESVPHDDFSGLGRRLDAVVAGQNLDLNTCVLNFTGGNKLMATAGFRWAARRSVRACYLERGNSLIWFEPGESEFVTRTEKIRSDVCNGMDPLPLLRCQLDASEVERDGEKLTLSGKGCGISETELFQRVENGAPVTEFLTSTGTGDATQKAGDGLELAAAAVLLKLGVPMVRRSLRLKVKAAAHLSTRKPHAELDLLFNWSGRLWLVDCKDRKAPEKLAQALRSRLGGNALGPETRDLLRRIESELSIGQAKVLKEDLIAMREMGGLLGQIVCVRKSELGEEVTQFARSQRIEIVPKKNLASSFRSLLFPESRAVAGDLSALQKQFQRP